MSAYLSLAPIIQATQAENASASPGGAQLETSASREPTPGSPLATAEGGVARWGRRRLRHILRTDIVHRHATTTGLVDRAE